MVHITFDVNNLIKQYNGIQCTTYFLQDSFVVLFALDLFYLGKIFVCSKIMKIYTTLYNDPEFLGLFVANGWKNKIRSHYSRSETDDRTRLQVTNQAYERVEEFKYMGTIIDENNEIGKEAHDRRMQGLTPVFARTGRCCSHERPKNQEKYSVAKLLIIQPATLYRCKIWPLTKNTKINSGGLKTEFTGVFLVTKSTRTRAQPGATHARYVEHDI